MQNLDSGASESLPETPFQLACADDFSSLLSAILQTHGLQTGVRFLNSMSAFRCTGLYRFDGDVLTSLYLHDREQPELLALPPLPVNDSYCVNVLNTGDAFIVKDSFSDERVATHPQRCQVRSYTGVPLINEEGRIRGTICHFDPAPNRGRLTDMPRLQAFAEVIQQENCDPMNKTLEHV